MNLPGSFPEYITVFDFVHNKFKGYALEEILKFYPKKKHGPHCELCLLQIDKKEVRKHKHCIKCGESVRAHPKCIETFETKDDFCLLHSNAYEFQKKWYYEEVHCWDNTALLKDYEKLTFIYALGRLHSIQEMQRE
jgi:hypothetical protein